MTLLTEQVTLRHPPKAHHIKSSPGHLSLVLPASRRTPGHGSAWNPSQTPMRPGDAPSTPGTWNADYTTPGAPPHAHRQPVQEAFDLRQLQAFRPGRCSRGRCASTTALSER